MVIVATTATFTGMFAATLTLILSLKVGQTSSMVITMPARITMVMVTGLPTWTSMGMIVPAPGTGPGQVCR